MPKTNRSGSVSAVTRNAGKMPTGYNASRGVSVVYYVRMNDGTIKIGTTKDLANRVRHSGMPGWSRRNSILAVEFGDIKLERQRHEEFAHLRVGNTEMFVIADDLLLHVEQIRRQHNIVM